MIKLHTYKGSGEIWLNENLIVSLRPSGTDNTDIYMYGDYYYTVIGKPSTIARMVITKESE